MSEPWGPSKSKEPRAASIFPNPRNARGDIIAIGGPLTVETLRDAYRHGIFPWPHDGLPLPWFSPRRRTVIAFDEVHVGRSLRKAAKRNPYRFTIDQKFRTVMKECSAISRPDQDGTWITPEFLAVYGDFHGAGDAHSVEAWSGDTLVGGLYGIDAGGVFTGESMFHYAPDASKLALLFLIEHLRERGATWIDCQVMTPHMEALGAKEIPRARFLDMLEKEQQSAPTLF